MAASDPRSVQGHRVHCVGEEDRLEVIYESSVGSIWTPSQIGELLKIHPSVIHVHQLESIPYKSSGKVDYLKLAQEIAK